MKRIITWIAVLLIMLQTCGFTAGLAAAPERDYDHLTVGNPTEMSGHFTFRLWGNSTSDIDVQSLVNGYNLVFWNQELNNYDFNPTVITGMLVTNDEAGNRKYTIILNDTLRYSDGSRITAKDYAFSILLQASPAIEELDGSTHAYQAILGANAYRAGESKMISGVSVKNDKTLCLTVKASSRPYYFELGKLDCFPMPVAVIAPGCTVCDDGEGAFLQGEMTAEMLKETLLSSTSGYLTHPTVVSGPYRLLSFDGITAELEKNPYFQGNHYGEVPTIKSLTYTAVNNKDMIQRAVNGEIDLLNKVTEQKAVKDGVNMLSYSGFDVTAYARTGLNLISFCCENSTVASKAVRQAIAFCTDRKSIIKDYLGGQGIVADGLYGLGQWTYSVTTGNQSLTAEDAQKLGDTRADLKNLRIYDLNIPEANRLLDAEGWTLNQNGAPYTSDVSEIRSKLVDGELVSLDLTLLCAKENSLGDLLQKYLGENLQKAGIHLTVKTAPWEEVFACYHTAEKRDCDMILMAMNFQPAFDPTDMFDPADFSDNYTHIQDRTLYELALNVGTAADSAEYLSKWVEFENYFTETLPMVPLYSNVYYDFYTDTLHDYYVNDTATWSDAIVQAFMSDPNLLAEPNRHAN